MVEALKRGNGPCMICGQFVEQEQLRDDLSKREFQISGLCQKCQDDTFGAGVSIDDSQYEEDDDISDEDKNREAPEPPEQGGEPPVSMRERQEQHYNEKYYGGYYNR